MIRILLKEGSGIEPAAVHSDVEIGADLHDTTAGRDEVEDPAPAGQGAGKVVSRRS
jgi:hypothetical protein